MANQTARTVSVQARSNISYVCISPDQQVLLQIDTDGYGQLVLLRNDAVLAHLNFHEQVSIAKFSPDTRHLAIALGHKLKIFQCAFHNKKFLGTLLPHLSFSSWHSDTITGLAYWKNYLITSSNDQTVRLCLMEKGTGYVPITLTGHRKPVLGAFPSENFIFSASSDARVFVWEWEEASEKFLQAQKADYRRRVGKNPKNHSNSEQLTLRQKHQLQHEGAFDLTCISMQGGLLVAGFKTGNFALYSVSAQEITVLHTLKMSDFEISAISINSTGEWLAFGSKTIGQLLVWEWKSESYILRQMGHSSQLLSACFSPDGHILATGGIDGKIKLWEKGICFATFSEHTHGVVDIVFSRANTLISCSKDGTVRAYDINKYKQFRVLTTQEQAEFMCLAVDRSGEIIAAGSSSYVIYVWALPTGILCDVLSGHSSPVSSAIFLPSGTLVSGAWDRSLRIWDVFQHKGGCETLDLSGEVLALAGRNDGKQIAASLANGEISLWSLGDLQENFILECRRDAAGGRGIHDRFTAKNNPNNKKFNSLAYSPDGNMLLAAGNSKYLCIYDLKHKTLFFKVPFTENRALSGVLDKLNSKNMTEAGPINELDLDEYDSFKDIDEQGVTAGHRPGSINKKELQVRASKVAFANNGKIFGIVTTEGLLVYSADSGAKWLPMSLDTEITKPKVIESLIKQDYTTALITALILGEDELTKNIIMRIPVSEIASIVSQIVGTELISLINILGKEAIKCTELGFIMGWVMEICKAHSQKLRGHSELRNLLRNLVKKYNDLAWMAQENTYLLQFLSR